ncbi:LLM class F420-dependent oxidoreductase [Williamsia deligens]
MRKNRLREAHVKLGLQLGYWGAGPIENAPELIAAAEESGFDAVFTAESWGSDAFTPLAWWGSATSRVRLGTAVAQISARPPTSLAMHALTVDHLSGGRHILGIGVSGPQVVEGWYGQPFAKPLARTREYVQVIRDVLDRQGPVINAGPHYPLPYPSDAPGATGLGKSLKPITHPLRSDLPIWLGAEGPKNIALAGEIADGWLAIYYTPRLADRYEEWLAEGMSRPGARRTREEFEVAATVQVEITDDVAATVDSYKPITAFYLGGMGAKDLNFHAEVYRRMGYAEAVDEISALFAEGRRDEAIAAVPDELVRETMIVGDTETVRTEIKRWEAAGVSMLMVTARSADLVRRLGELV